MSLKKQKIQLLFPLTFCLAVIFLIFPELVQAHGLVPCGGVGENACTVTDIFVLIARVTNFLLGTAGIFAVYQIINHGLYLSISMGSEEAITKHRSGIQNAVLGFVFAMFAFMFVNTAVNIILTSEGCQKLDLTNPITYLNINANTTQCAKAQ